jgi:hypothetical protein
MFHFPWCRSVSPIEFRLMYPGITRDGFPHSEIPGSKCVCHSPELIAACHVLRRLPVPRHSSCALLRLTRNFWPSRQKLHALSLCSFQRTNPPHDRYNQSGRTAECRWVTSRCTPVEVSSTHNMVGVPGIEPGTLSLSGTRSNQLSYTPIETRNSELGTRSVSAFPVPRSCWWRQPGSNR